MARDRLSALDDSLLCFHIPPKLPLKDAVCCSILSRRWRPLWTLLPHLKFSNADFNENVLDNIMFFHQSDLQSLEISLNYRLFSDERNIPRMLGKSVYAAAVKRVKQLTSKNAVSSEQEICLYVPTSLFSCDRLTFLQLRCFQMQLPSYFSGFRYLRICFLSTVRIIDDMLEQLAAKCQLLKKLSVRGCSVGLNNLKICADNLNYFYFIGNFYTNSSLTLTVNCRRLENVKIQVCPPLSKLELNSCRDLHVSTTNLHVLECLSSRNSVRKITLSLLRSIRLPSLTVLGRFSNLEELSIESESFEASSLAAGSLTLPVMTNLKKMRIRVTGLDADEIAMLSCFLRNAPSLQTMTLIPPICSEYNHEQSFLKQLLALNRSFGQVIVLVTAKHGAKCKRCLCPSYEEEKTQMIKKRLFR